MNLSRFLQKHKYIFLVIFILFLVSLTNVAFAQEAQSNSDQELAERYAPMLYFHRDELFRPQPVEVMVHTARLRQDIQFWFDVNVLNEVTIQDLITYHDASYVLDIWYGHSGASDYMNYSAHKAYYESFLSPEAGGPPITTYTHVVRNYLSGETTIQYWLFYYYNDFFNKHEGDWELVQVILNRNEEPEWVIMSQHHGGTRRAWEDTQIEAGTHPATYVALGSHANYFWGEEIYPIGQDIGTLSVYISDRTGTHGRVIPQVTMIPDREDLETAPEAWSESEWLIFSGHWGELAIQGDFGGPIGPADKGKQWDQPLEWGMEQPLDIESWYKNRLRVEIIDKFDKLDKNRVRLRNSSGGDLSAAESISNMALLHEEPPTDTQIIADIEVFPNQSFNVIATWPDVENSQVIPYEFIEVPPISSGTVQIIFNLDGKPILKHPIITDPIYPIPSPPETAVWDSLDPVWVVGLLPASDVAKGIIISLLAGVLPTILYVSIIYWSDRYEKEPRSLLTTAFLWGAIPAILIAIIISIFFELPVELIGPKAIEAIRLGFITPLVEEALKGLVILYIARRYRREFDNVLDGIIYGAMVGFGFAMTGNIISYLGAFLLKGFPGLNITIFIEGILFGFNHALYSAFFGAGLGFARLTQKRIYRWTIPLSTFVMAILINAIHNLTIQNVIGLNLYSILLPWVGVLVIVIIMTWSLLKESRTLAVELEGEIPPKLYDTITHNSKRRKSLQQMFFRKGIKEWRNLRKLYQLCAELAFKKLQGGRFPEEKEVEIEINKLRREIFELIELNQLGTS